MSDKNMFSTQWSFWSSHPFAAVLWVFFQISTAMIGFAWHKSIFWAIVNFIFPVLTWLKWLICQDVNMTIIKSAFSFFFN